MDLRLLALVLAVLVLFAPAAVATVIGVELYRSDDTFMSAMRKVMEESAEGLATLEVTDGQNDQTVQNDWICRHAAEGVDVVALRGRLRHARQHGQPIAESASATAHFNRSSSTWGSPKFIRGPGTRPRFSRKS